MSFQYVENTKTVTEINKLLKEDQLFVDDSYQRRAIWTEMDKVRLIETILLNFVVPSVYWWQSEIDSDTGEARTHIVDGQQRIMALRQFINNDLELKTSYLLDELCKKKYGGKRFSDLDADIKRDFWNYKISVIEIDQKANTKDIINMFKRLNLTEYTLNSQEKRHAEKGLFHEFATELSKLKFWENVKVFSATDIKRMQDITYSATIIILSKRGIIDQTKIDEPINRAYEQYKEEYPKKEMNEDKFIIEQAMTMIEKLLGTSEAKIFLRRKIQLYTVFSIVFYMIRKDIPFTDKTRENFNNFAIMNKAYKNENSLSLEFNTKESELYDNFRKYKLSSSEGTNKLSNRVIRFDVMKDFVIESNYSKEVFDIVISKLKA